MSKYVATVPRYILVLDTETTGLDPERNVLLSIGACLFDFVNAKKPKLISSFNRKIDVNSIIENKHPMTAMALKINNYFEVDILNQGKYDCKEVEPKRVAVDFMKYSVQTCREYGPVFLLGQNLKFDVDFINKFMLRELGIEGWREMFDRSELDTKNIALFLNFCGVTDYQYFSLSALCKLLNIDIDSNKQHDALYDAELTAMVFYELSNKIKNLVAITGKTK